MKTSENFAESAGIVDQVDDNTIYFCYPLPGTTSEYDASWSIMRAKKIDTAWHYTWANGTQEKIFKASDRASLNYTFLK